MTAALFYQETGRLVSGKTSYRLNVEPRGDA